VKEGFTMTKSSCYSAFGEGKAQRVTYPLHQGRYKLEEREGRFIAAKETLRMVREFVSGRSRCLYLGGCMASDKHTWLKNLPLDIAFSLGYDLLPGLLALKKEGALCVDREYPAIEQDCLQLVARCEQVRNAIRKNIKVEYRQMKQGDSLIEPLIEEAMELTRRALAVR
jgi:hypothetical protein